MANGNRRERLAPVNKKLMKRLSLDLLMVVLILLEFAYEFTGSTVHKLIGLSMLSLFIVHGAWNWRWFANLFKGKYGGLRVSSMAINVLLLIAVSLMLVSGVLNSDLLFSLLQIELELLPRELHTASAYWLLILMGVHLGMHWTLIMNQTRKFAGVSWAALPLPLRTASLHAIAASLAIYGVVASFEREVFSRLMAYFSFGDRGADDPILVLFLQYAAIVGLYGFLTYHALQLFKNRSQSRFVSAGQMCIDREFNSWRTSK